MNSLSASPFQNDADPPHTFDPNCGCDLCMACEAPEDADLPSRDYLRARSRHDAGELAECFACHGTGGTDAPCGACNGTGDATAALRRASAHARHFVGNLSLGRCA